MRREWPVQASVTPARVLIRFTARVTESGSTPSRMCRRIGRPQSPLHLVREVLRVREALGNLHAVAFRPLDDEGGPLCRNRGRAGSFCRGFGGGGQRAPGQLGEEAPQRRSVRAEVQRVHPDGLDAPAALRVGQVQAAAVAPHRQVRGPEEAGGGGSVFLEADHRQQDSRGPRDVGASRQERRKGELSGHGIAVGGRKAGQFGGQGLTVRRGQDAEETARRHAGTTRHAHDLQPEPPAPQLVHVGCMDPHSHLQVRRQAGFGRPRVQGVDQLVGEDHLVTAVERGGLRQPYEGVVPGGEARSAGAGRGARVALRVTDAAVGDDFLERHHRADAVPLVEPLVVRAPHRGAVRAGADPGQEQRGALDLAGDRVRQYEPRVQAQVERDRVAAEARHEGPHPRCDTVAPTARSALPQRGANLPQLVHDPSDRGEGVRVDHVELIQQISEGVGLGARRVQTRDQHTPPDQLRQQSVHLLLSGLGELRLELVRELTAPDRLPCRGEDQAHRLGQSQRRLHRASPLVLGVGLKRHDEPVAATRHGVVDDHGQAFEEVRAGLHPLDDGGQPLRARMADDPVFPAPACARLRAESRGGHTGEETERRRPVLRTQQVAGHGQCRTPHLSRGRLRGRAHAPYPSGQNRAGVFQGFGEVAVGQDRTQPRGARGDPAGGAVIEVRERRTRQCRPGNGSYESGRAGAERRVRISHHYLRG
ncbi:hypothetical protein GCM10023323_23730 [Streptomyces thinghirensis]|uniref:Uncharacterized protein n=1 Tax=Streptomyces thinghirensis TaxID=551547 RepID=A0ABP9T0H3_9ACTN